MWILKYNWQNVMLEQRLKNHSAIKLKIVVLVTQFISSAVLVIAQLLLSLCYYMSMGFTGNCHTTLWDTGDSPPAV